MPCERNWVVSPRCWRDIDLQSVYNCENGLLSLMEFNHIQIHTHNLIKVQFHCNLAKCLPDTMDTIYMNRFLVLPYKLLNFKFSIVTSTVFFLSLYVAFYPPLLKMTLCPNWQKKATFSKEMYQISGKYVPRFIFLTKEKKQSSISSE